MPVYLVAETPAGYGLFKSTDKKILKRDDLVERLASAEAVVDMLKLKKFEKYDSPIAALEEAAALVKGQVPPLMAKLLDDIKDPADSSVAITDSRLASGIHLLPGFEKTSLHSDTRTEDIFRAIREHLDSLLPETQSTFERVALGLSHSLHRHKLKFSADKIDTMIVQAVKLIEDMDRELNVYAMRTREWYGWHFPELARLVNDNLAYARIIIVGGSRQRLVNADLSTVLPENLVDVVKGAAEISMGTDITEEDEENIKLLASQVVQYSDYRTEISTFLENRMKALAPNLTALVGYLVGAKLIAHTGSLRNLSMSAASTIQILGAEKALFRALKTKHNTPKYGILYSSSLVGQASTKNKGKIARMLAAKTALGLRIDAIKPTMRTETGEEIQEDDAELDDEERAFFGLTQRTKLENRLRALDGKPLLPRGVAVGPDGQITQPGQFALKESRGYNKDSDGVANGSTPGKPLIEEVNDAEDAMDVDENGDASSVRSASTIGTVSDDSETDSESPAEYASSKEAKKARKERKAKIARREARQERRDAREEQQKRRAAKAAAAAAKSKATESDAAGKTPKLSEEALTKLAADAGISVTKFKRKLERGDVQLNPDGSVRVFSKKEMKKLRKAQEEEKDDAVVEEKPKSKRKRDDEDKPEKKQKKKKTSRD